MRRFIVRVRGSRLIDLLERFVQNQESQLWLQGQNMAVLDALRTELARNNDLLTRKLGADQSEIDQMAAALKERNDQLEASLPKPAEQSA